MFDRLQRNKKIFHLLCSSVLSIFLLQTLAWSAPAQAPSIPSASLIQIPVSEIIRNPAKLPIPSEHATLKEFHVGNNGKLIIHFQDAHSNYSGQLNMAKALETMMKQTGIDVVFVEGADQEVTLRETKKVTDQKTWGVAANRLLLQGIISGEEYLNLTSDLPVRLMGMEYQDLYDENLITYKDLIRHREAAGKYMSQIKTKVRSLKERLYTDDLL
ncbi:MAG: hypothetical protein KC649_04455, partial [Candidatus Omnitrophica bacterium]|nr:hypothetical protein [Candidatus Omnitrophota bacterium]